MYRSDLKVNWKEDYSDNSDGNFKSKNKGENK